MVLNCRQMHYGLQAQEAIIDVVDGRMGDSDRRRNLLVVVYSTVLVLQSVAYGCRESLVQHIGEAALKAHGTQIDTLASKIMYNKHDTG